MQDYRQIIRVHEILNWKDIQQNISRIKRAGLPLREVRKSLERDGIPQWEISGFKADGIVVLHRDMLKELPHTKAGKVKVTGIPVKLSETPGELLLGPPLLGEQTEDILKDLGYSQKEINQFKKDKVV